MGPTMKDEDRYLIEGWTHFNPRPKTKPDLSTVEKRNAFYSSDEYKNMTTAEKCAVQGDGTVNDYD